MTVDIQRAPHAGWRALAATVLVMVGAVAAHTWAGGHLPDGPVLIALTALVLGCSLLALRGTVPTLVLLPVVATAQAGLHTSFAMSATHHGGHPDLAEPAATWGWQMVVAHLAVTALAAAVWHVCGRAAEVVVSALHVLPTMAIPRSARSAPTGAPRLLSHLVLLVAAPTRGPPAVASCA